MLKDLINEDLKCYMKQKNVAALNAVKLLKTDIKKTEVDTMTVLDDEGVVKILKKQMKMRKESIEQYTAAGRTDLVQNEEEELKYLIKYLPQEMSDDQLKVIIEQVVSELNATTSKDFGKVMKEVLARTKGKADNSKISGILKGLLH